MHCLAVGAINAIYRWIFLKRMPQSQVDHFQILTFIEHFQTLGGDFSTTIKVDRAQAFYLLRNGLHGSVRQFDALPDVERVEGLHVGGEAGDALVGHLAGGHAQGGEGGQAGGQVGHRGV